MDPVKILPAFCILALLFCAGCASQEQVKATTPAVPTATTVMPASAAETSPVTPAAPPAPTTPAPLYPNALALKSPLTFGNGTTWVSDAAVNRIWMNDTYRWFNPRENQYETRVASPGTKFLIVFLTMVNRGTERAPLPPRGNIYVLYDSAVVSPDTVHPLPKMNPNSVPSIARIAEIENSRSVYSSEQVGDYGYSQGQKLEYINPGESNAVEGYIIFDVPASVVPATTYVKIVLPDRTEGTWVLG